MSILSLKGKTVIITGASAGFGRGTAYAFAKEGANLVLTARREERLKEAADKCKELGGNAVYYVGDARDEETAINTVKLAVDTFGGVDILVNNAGIGRILSILDTSMDEYDLVMDSNVRSAYAFSKYAIPEMLKKHNGHIIIVSSVTGTIGQKNETAYTCSKFAVRGLGQALVDEYLDQGIKTTVFCPHAGVTEFEIGHGRDAATWGDTGFLSPEDVGQALVSVCQQTDNCYVAELRLASNNVKFL
ncbi:MAG: SDR family oxidoreductase [Lachnospiraceae bacterium]|nr:SDR family oxidoreductase [Lachnospiraceae bacterium]